MKRIIFVFLFLLSSIVSCSKSSTNDHKSTNQEKDIITMFENIEVVKTSKLFENMQDGCIYNDTMFLFNGNGSCFVYEAQTEKMIGIYQLPSYEGIVPHSNSVCFGEKYKEDDEFPLLYTNIYNNYPDNPETYGTCFVYRIFRDDLEYSFCLVQIIKVSFTDHVFFWYNNSENSSPFGNFLVYKNDLFVYVNIIGNNVTRFFRFNLPKIDIGSGKVDFVFLNIDDVTDLFDTFLFRFVQGGKISDGLLFSLEGFGDNENPGFLRIINLELKFVISVNLNVLIGGYEPEFIDLYSNNIIIGTNDGILFYLRY